VIAHVITSVRGVTGLRLKLGKSFQQRKNQSRKIQSGMIRRLPLSPFSGVSPGMMTSRILSPQVEYPRTSRFLKYEAGRKLHATSKVAQGKQIEMFGGVFATENPKDRGDLGTID
jgi:hypothetical protein